MSFQKIVCFGLFVLVLCAGCGLKEGVVQKDPKSYFWFTGNTANAIVYIDDLDPIILNKNAEKRDKIHYEISPGKHRVIVRKSGEEVVNRNVLLGNGIIKEIQIPWKKY